MTNKILSVMFVTLVVTLMFIACGKTAKKDAAHIGVYPGNPDESFAPELVVDNATYRNVAELRSAYHSSSYDYNLTAQLVTDGIISDKEPSTVNLSTQAGDIPKNKREYFFDGKSDSKYVVKGQDIYLQLDLNNMDVAVDKFVLVGSVALDPKKAKGFEVLAYGSNDGAAWTVLAQNKGAGFFGTERPAFGFFNFPMPAANAPKPEPVPSPVIFNYDYTPLPQAPQASPFGNFGGGAQNGAVTRVIAQEVLLKEAATYKHYKVALKMKSAVEWTFTDWNFYHSGELLDMLPGFYFNSVWQSAGADEEWVYVDFGAPASIDKLNLFWVNKAVEGKIQTSDNAKDWIDLSNLPGGSAKEDAIVLGKTIQTQYLRLLLTKSENDKPYILSELQAFGKGGLVARPKNAPALAGNRQTLSGGNWKLQRSSLVAATGKEISTPGFDEKGWLIATVPGTVLASFINLGAVPDPNFSDNQLQVSDSYFLSDFWYRNEFEVSNASAETFLNFDGINWKANIFLNGEKIGNIDGAFIRGKFDVSKLVKQGKNVIAVEIVKNAHPGAIKEQTAYSTDQNGGIPGADNPTFHASIGWDWIPTIRGRDIGIWNDVFLTYTGSVTIEDPFVRTELPLPATNSANVIAEVTLVNHSDNEITGLLKGTYGELAFAQEVTLAPSETKSLTLDPTTHPELTLQNPKLWWPKGYGEQYLYDVTFAFEIGGKVSDKIAFKSGVRQMTFDENVYQPSGGMSFGFFGGESRRLSLYVNGRRFIGYGGNWGFGESNLNYRGREYDIAVAYHADMNFTIIRNWVGQVGDEEFYEACDKYGVMVWQDFWLANPADGPNPYYPDMFNANADDFIKRIRNHPSIGIYVGRNEGNPPPEIDNHLRAVIPQLHPGIHYISNSASGVVSGGGPYRALPPKDYFRSYGHDKFHSERGMPAVMNYESLVQAFGEKVEPVNTIDTPNSIYGLHDYTLGGTGEASAQAANSFNEIIEKAFGKPKDAKQFAEWAQWVNYDGYRAIFEGRSEHRRGMLLWMSHPAWPSMVWQTYDYYFDPTGAYFGSKKASEPIHIQWNPLREDVEVVNYHAFDKTGITAKAQLISQDGKVQWEKEAILDIKEDATVAVFPLEFPETLSSAYFIKLTLTEGGKVISDNFYWRGKEEGNLKSLLEVPKVKLTAKTTTEKSGGEWLLTTTLKNDTQIPALMIRLKVEGDSGERILPVFFSDNYFFLMPGEEKTVTMKFSNNDTRGEKPSVTVSGFNI
ncbi:MAG: discoidin domain-containing protein [Candidatus Symbiothrix sp.]|nr:discoidin domain-containing protein [Candidatus Symbiothrix sp.]